MFYKHTQKDRPSLLDLNQARLQLTLEIPIGRDPGTGRKGEPMRQTLLLSARDSSPGPFSTRRPCPAQEDFPHDRHSLFFSDCSVCHGGITAGAPADPYPEFSFCAACHDGTTAPSIRWEQPEPRASNLSFDHTRHDFGCSTCHLPEGEEDLTQLGFPKPELCLGCHAPQAKSHLEAEQC